MSRSVGKTEAMFRCLVDEMHALEQDANPLLRIRISNIVPDDGLILFLQLPEAEARRYGVDRGHELVLGPEAWNRIEAWAHQLTLKHFDPFVSGVKAIAGLPVVKPEPEQ